MSSRRETRAATALLHATGAAAASVIAARVQAFSDPATLLSPWHQSEARRMTAEKLDAASQGMQAAGIRHDTGFLDEAIDAPLQRLAGRRGGHRG